MQNLSIRTKLLIAFAAMVALTALQGFIAISRLDALNGMSAEIEGNWLPATHLAGALKTAASDYRLAEAKHIIAVDQAERDRSEREMRELSNEMEKAERQYVALINSAEEQRIYDEYKLHWAQYLERSRELLTLSTVGEDAAATEIFHGRSRAVFLPANDLLEQLVHLNVQGGTAASKRGDAMFQQARSLLVLMMAATGLAALGLALAMTGAVARPARRVTAALTALAAGDKNVEIPDLDRRDEIGDMARAADVFKTMAERTEGQHWVKSNVAELAGALQHAESQQAFAETFIRKLVPLMGAGLGVFYVFDPASRKLALLGSYGYRARKSVSNAFALGEGLVGQCALEGTAIELTDLPDDYVAIGSGLGEAKPRRIVAAPMRLKDHLLGVVEIASFGPFDERQQALLDEILPVAALILENLERAQKTQELLQETERQAEALRASEEELRLQSEELKTTNEELRAKSENLARQTEELQASDEELRAQREELQAANEELTEKSAALEEQSLAVQAAREEAEGKARELARSSQYKSEFLANMSHELRTPLNSMLILSKMLADNEERNLNADQVQSARIVHESGSQLLRLINDILDLSKIEAGRVEVQEEEVPLASIADTIQRKFRHMAEARGLELELAMDEDLPRTLRTDGGKLDQILTNLVGNALKFTDAGRIDVRFSTAAPVRSGDGPMLAVAVADTGIGIPADKLHRIFEAFEQADGSTSRRYGGTGLGLSISRRLAQLLGGELRVVSTPGRGSTFTLLVPLVDGGGRAAVRPMTVAVAPVAAAVPAPVPAAREAARTAPPFPAGAGDGRTILIIEDDPGFARVLGELAEKKGFHAVYAANGETGLRLAAAEQPSGIILDVCLPGTDGWAVIDRLKADPRTEAIPVHFITALGEPEKGMSKGAASYLVKPATREQINTVLDSVSNGASGRKRLLVIDGDGDRAAALSELLSDGAVSVVEATNGAKALSHLGSEFFDAIVTDVELPDLGVPELLEQARAAIPGGLPPVIVHAHRALTGEESLALREFTDSFIVEGGRSRERLLDEARLFLHSVRAQLPGTGAGTGTAETGGGLRGRTVLVVDDDMRNAFALSKLLRQQGMKVLIAEDGHKALAQLDGAERIDIVLMDIMMPGMDGYETMRRIRERPAFADLPILALTAKAMKGDRELCIEAGASDYLSKPIDTALLLAAIGERLAAPVS